MAKIQSPVKGFSGDVVGVRFDDGHAESDMEGALTYFRRHGYTIEEAAPAAPVQPAEGEPSEAWTHGQLDAYASAHGIDLAGAGKKAEKVAVIVAAAEPATE